MDCYSFTAFLVIFLTFRYIAQYSTLLHLCKALKHYLLFLTFSCSFIPLPKFHISQFKTFWFTRDYIINLPNFLDIPSQKRLVLLCDFPLSSSNNFFLKFKCLLPLNCHHLTFWVFPLEMKKKWYWTYNKCLTNEYKTNKSWN